MQGSSAGCWCRRIKGSEWHGLILLCYPFGSLKRCHTIIGLLSLVAINFGALEGAEIRLGPDRQSKLILQLEEDEVAIFGFGSLMLKETLHCDGEDICNSRPYVMARLKGFKRSWSAQYPNDDFFEDEEGFFFKPRTVTYLKILNALRIRW